MPGPPGFEDRVREFLKSQLDKGEVFIDNLGNLIVKLGNGPFRVMLCAHMDEVGLMISHIDQRGFARVIPLGDIDPKIMLGEEVVFLTEEGGVSGVVSTVSPHLGGPKTPKRFSELIVDFGFKSRDEAFKHGIRPGTPGVFAPRFISRGEVIMGKAFDDRLGCVALLEAFKSTNSINDEVTLFFVWTTQEEAGLRGVRTALNYVNPHFAIVVETTIANDISGVPEELWITRIDGGAAIRLYDRSLIANRNVVDKAVEIAERHGIKYQFQINPYGATDAGPIHLHRLGVPTLVVSIPARYIHSPLSIASLSDMSEAIRLLKALIGEVEEFRRIVRHVS